MGKLKSAKKTLLLSVIMSSPGPLVVGLSLLLGKSSTQIADFVRRTIELLSIILAFAVYCATTTDDVVDEIKKQKYEKIANIIVSIAMIISGFVMTAVVLLSSGEEETNVIPGLLIALSGVGANCLFWRKYTKLGKETNNKILIVQGRLYRGKSLVDISVTIALSAILILKNSNLSYWFDLIGTICVSIYLVFTGATTLNGEFKKEIELSQECAENEEIGAL